MSAIAPALSGPAGLTILRCPHCAAAEPVESATLAGQAQMIRCRRCGQSWPARDGASAAFPAPAFDAKWGRLAAGNDAARNGWAARILADEPPAPPRRRPPWRFALCCLAALTLPAGFLIGLHSAIDLPVQGEGLMVEGVEAERRFGDTGTAIKVAGRIVNGGGEAQPVPQLVIQFRDRRNGLVLHRARAAAPVKHLAPGASARFVVEVGSVPKEAGQVLVRLGEAR